MSDMDLWAENMALKADAIEAQAMKEVTAREVAQQVLLMAIENNHRFDSVQSNLRQTKSIAYLSMAVTMVTIAISLYCFYKNYR